jgi:hypothetical protein
MARALRKMREEQREQYSRLETKLDAALTEVQTLKRTTEQLQSELAKRPCTNPEVEGTYYYIKLEIERPPETAGVRAAIYKHMVRLGTPSILFSIWRTRGDF